MPFDQPRRLPRLGLGRHLAAGIAEFIKLGADVVTISSLGLLRLGVEDFRKRASRRLCQRGRSRQTRPTAATCQYVGPLTPGTTTVLRIADSRSAASDKSSRSAR